MTIYNWQPDPTKTGTPVNMDNVNEDLMYLKDQSDLLLIQSSDLSIQVGSLDTGKVNGAGLSLWMGTQAEYDSLSTYDPFTIYYVD